MKQLPQSVFTDSHVGRKTHVVERFVESNALLKIGALRKPTYQHLSSVYVNIMWSGHMNYAKSFHLVKLIHQHELENFHWIKTLSQVKKLTILPHSQLMLMTGKIRISGGDYGITHIS